MTSRELEASFWNSGTHSRQVNRRTEAVLKDGSLDAGARCPREDLVVGNVVLTNDAKNSSDIRLLEPLQTFDVLTIQSPCHAGIQKVGEDHGLEDNDSCSYIEAVIVEYPLHERCLIYHNVFDFFHLFLITYFSLIFYLIFFILPFFGIFI